MIALILVLVSGLLGSGILWKHERLLTYLAGAGALFEFFWLGLTFVDRVLLVTVPSQQVYTAGASILLVLWFMVIKWWRFPDIRGRGIRDVAVLAAMVPVLAAAVLVWQYNGLRSGSAWEWHGFFNGDTATLMALTQKSFFTPGLVTQNPFAGNGYLEYPTLVHGALAGFFEQVGVGLDWMVFLPVMTYAQIFLTIPLFFLLFDEFLPEPVDSRVHWLGLRKRWWVYGLQTLIVWYVLALSWDAYIYPQSHFFLMGLFVAVAALGVQMVRSKGAKRTCLAVTTGVFAVLLARANAVTGAAAVVVAMALFVWLSGNKKESVEWRGIGLVAAVLLGVLFLMATPGDSALGAPGFSYSGAAEMLRLGLPIVGLYAAILWQGGQRGEATWASMGLVGAAFLIFFFSQRNIVIENASRFLYHALLVGFPLALLPLLQLYFWLRRTLWYTSWPVLQKFALFAGLLASVLLVAFPALASMASAHDNLQFGEERVISLQERELFWWIEEHTKPDDVFLVNPFDGLMLPAYTGRAILRSEYWLSPGDIIQEDVVGAFAGEEAAREQVVPLADYLVLAKERVVDWGALAGEQMFENGEYVVFRL